MCLKGYFRATKGFLSNFPRMPGTFRRFPLGSTLVQGPPPGPAQQRTPRGQPHPQPAPREAGPAPPSRGRRAAAILLGRGGGGGDRRGRPMARGGPAAGLTAGIYKEPLRWRWRTKGTRDSGASLHTPRWALLPGSIGRRPGVAGLDHKKRGLKAIHPHQQLWSDSLQATKAEMSRPEHATEGLGSPPTLAAENARS